MNLYSIITPHDPYTFYAEDDKQAIMAGLLIGEGKYSILDIKDKPVLPLMTFIGKEGLEKWLKAKFNISIKQFFIKEQESLSPIKSLESLLVCSIESRDFLEKSIDGTGKKDTYDKWHKDHKTSITDLRKIALVYANAYRRRQKKETS